MDSQDNPLDDSQVKISLSSSDHDVIVTISQTNTLLDE